jgi:hypothetical protein
MIAMKRRDFLRKSLSIAAATIPAGIMGHSQKKASPPAHADGWIPIFNGRNLDGWYTFLQKSGKNNDPEGYVRVEKGMIHILGDAVKASNPEPGYLSTEREFANCRLRFEYKWGLKRYEPRLEAKRDNGILYHLVAPDKVWPKSVEFQMLESDTGDAVMIGGVRAAPGGTQGGVPFWPNRSPIPEMQIPAPQLVPGRPQLVPKQGFFEKYDDWNTLEIIMDGDKAAHLVNGRIVNSIFDIQQPDPQNAGQWVRLDHGRIAIEIIYAEIWFRTVAFRPLS